MDDQPENTQEFSSVTQCPYCHTAFHVGLAQLDAAAGRVRCGGCLRVFNAKERFLVEQKRLFDDEPIAETEEAPIEEPGESADDPFIEVDLFGAEIPDEDEPVILGSFNHYSGISIPRRAILEDKVNAFRQEDYEHAPAEKVLSGHGHLLEDPSEANPEYISLSAVDNEPDPDFPESSTTESFREFSAADNEAPDESTWDEGPGEEQLAFSEAEPEADGIRDEISIENGFTVEAERLTTTQATGPQAQTDDFFIQHSAKSPRKAGTLWWIALVLVIVSLPAQLLFTQPDSLVIKSWFQQLGAVVCPRIGCTVPEYNAPDLVHISGFIEPHPEYQNGLVAKIDLRNRGLAEQPFPPVAIYFRNLNGQITASRVFQPAEYLQGEARGYRHMPVNRDVQLELELLDPGEQSTSYELYVVN